MPFLMTLDVRCDKCGVESSVRYEMPDGTMGVERPKYEGPAAHWDLPHADRQYGVNGQSKTFCGRCLLEGK